MLLFTTDCAVDPFLVIVLVILNVLLMFPVAYDRAAAAIECAEGMSRPNLTTVTVSSKCCWWP